MALEQLPDGWFRFAQGKRWRMTPKGLCEIAEVGNTPHYLKQPGIKPKIQRIQAFYQGKLDMGALNAQGRGLDILVANAMTESFGSVPTPFSGPDLRTQLAAFPGTRAEQLDALVRSVSANKATRPLQRREPGYINPLQTPNRVSIGAHHALLTTALELEKKSSLRGLERETAIETILIRLLSESLYAARLAIVYFNRQQGRHQGQLPLLAACYNAGSPRFTSQNAWNLVQYGEHIDRWIAYYNTSRLLSQSVAVPSHAPQNTSTHTEMRSAGSQTVSPASPTPAPAPGPTAPLNTPVPKPGEPISAHISYRQATHSPTAQARKIDNTPDADTLRNMQRVAQLCYEPMVAHFGNKAIPINSFYRSSQLNKAIGGSTTSDHCLGRAIDIDSAGRVGLPTNAQIFHWLRKNTRFDQLIWEFGTDQEPDWVHISYREKGNRRQVLRAIKNGGKTVYKPM